MVITAWNTSLMANFTVHNTSNHIIRTTKHTDMTNVYRAVKDIMDLSYTSQHNGQVRLSRLLVAFICSCKVVSSNTVTSTRVKDS